VRSADELAYKPDSVSIPKDRGRPSIWGRRYRRPRCGLPAGSDGQSSNACVRLLAKPRLDLAPSGVYQAATVTRRAGGLLHHRFTLTVDASAYGGLFSVALSRGLPRVGVTHHLALWSPDFPQRRPEGLLPRPPSQLICVTRVAGLSLPRLRNRRSARSRPSGASCRQPRARPGADHPQGSPTCSCCYLLRKPRPARNPASH